MYEPGTVLVTKVTGAYAVVTKHYPDTNEVDVRMAVNLEDKATGYTSYTFFVSELETVEQHLRRELAEMELRQELLTAAKKRQQMRELEDSKPPAPVSKLTVN